MANQKKRFEFENTFGNSSRSPKRPKLEVIQRPSTSGTRSQSFENVDENDELWGDDLGNDVVQEVILLESQGFPLKPPVPKSEPTPKPTVNVFKPKTATAFPKIVTETGKNSGFRDDFRSGIVMKETKVPERRLPNLQPNVKGVVTPLEVEEVKSNSIGKGCSRSNSMPTIDLPGSSSTTSKTWSEIKDLSRKLVDNSMVKDQSDSSRPMDNSEEMKVLQKEIERLRSEAFTKAGEAALLRQKIKDTSLDLERERNYRATLLEKTNQKHQQEISALNRELEATKTQLQFKDLDVDKANEKCKLLEAGNLKVRPMELKLHSTLRSSNTSDFPSRSTFENNTPNKRAHLDVGSKHKQNVPEIPKITTNKVEVCESGIQTEDRFITMQKSRPELFSRVSEGEMLSRLIVPVWFEMDSGATEEQFENKWEGVSALTELLKMTVFCGEPMEHLVEWCWKRMLAFLSTLQKKSEDDYKFHQVREESRRQYEEWCLDRRIPLPPQKQSVDEGLGESSFCYLAEDSVKDDLQYLLSFRPWCPKDVLPEIRRTLALITVLIRVSKNMASAFLSHNQKSENENNSCYMCGSFIQRKPEFAQTSVNNVRNEQDLHDRVGESLHGSEDDSATKGFEIGCTPTCPASKKTCDNETEQDIEGEPKDLLKFDFVRVAQQICRVISGMRKILPMEGALAGVLAFLSSLGEQLVLSRRALLLVSAVVKDILFIRPHLRILPLLMRLLYVTGEYPLILQKLCVNSAWNTAYRDKWNNIWMFSKGVCPLQVLITILGNVAEESAPDEVNTETWYKFRAKIALLFVQWLNAALTQPGHQVDWLCYATSDEPESVQRENDVGALSHKESTYSTEKVVHSKKAAATPSKSRINSDEPKPSTSRGDTKNKSDTVELRKKCDNDDDDDNTDEDVGENLPYKSLSKLSISKLSSEESDNEKEEVEEPSKRCCCRRWIINILVNILYAVLLDLQSVTNPAYEVTVKEEGEELYYKASKTIISNKKLEHEQSLCLRLGLFVLRTLLRRDHPELNTPGGEGFLWNHYTVRGSVLINGQIVRKDYGHKNTHGGPIGGRYVLLLSKIENQMKERIMDFCPETEKALQELLEVENSVQSPSEDDEEEEEGSNLWDCMRNIGCNKDT